MSDAYDLAILGAGSAGYACALRAATLGLSVVMIDEAEVGGTCLHRGCIPTKAWLHAAKVRRTVSKAPSFGIGAELGDTDAEAIRAYADGVVSGLHRGLTGLLKSRGVTVVAARGSLEVSDAGPAIRTPDALHRASAVLVATGAAPATLGFDIDGERILTSNHALRLSTLPETAIVLGGGVIGVEFASLWADLGVSVTLLEATDRLLPGEEPGHVRVLRRELERRGVDIRLGAPATSAEATDGGVRVSAGSDSVSAELLLIAAGRRPVTSGIGLEEAGVTLSPSGHVVVDGNLQTAARNVYAAGDLVPGPQLAHRGYAHGIFVAERIAHNLGRHPRKPTPVRDVDIPRVVYSSPQLASVGVTLEAAGAGADSVDYHLTGNGRAQILRAPGERESGVVRMVRAADGRIVGLHAVGEDVSELIAEGALLVGWHATPEDVAGIIHPHPTLSEALAEANWALAGQPLHIHG
ncbi:FAD-dependent oxidoreductase [Tessaracoccus flavus]|uniref:Dihydrolipoyl dehydrogenase n=1 Tax=Tessaracoccus flavus TaxID=1610493 RepID=A0A1Q2CD35_9ACTN|nr:FAD-dependent oxidoreductase [Tessaracoccus flavus]AQP44007.1 dihydrolipoyl dehydrogenase [Tessaracoccus flavus]SDY31886.1 dihydrolipoamide dehydrogenase [Tessaracoccus flavus]